jgi:hypothetical protein
MERKVYCTGYMKVNDYKSWYDKEWKLNVQAEFLYVEEVNQECFSASGEKLGVHKAEKRYSKEETKIIDKINDKTVLQFGFDFFLVSKNESLNADTIDNFRRVLDNSGIGCFYVGGRRDNKEIYDKENRDYAKLIEVVCSGHSRSVYRNLGKSFFDLDLHQYKANLSRFIKNNSDSNKWLAEDLYKENISNLCDYFLCSESDLFKGKFTEKLIKRLHYNINNKQNGRR